jgi:hypothetical protein
MATEKLNLALRRDLDGNPVHDDIDPDRLSPSGRALFQALQRPHASLDIPMRSRKTRREMGYAPGVWISEADLDRPVTMSWRGWSDYPPDSTMDIHEYLDREAMKIDPGYAPTAADPYPARMTIGQVLAYLNARGRKITAATWRAYVSRDQAPRPTEYVSRTPLWDAVAIEEWHGRGARTDIFPLMAYLDGHGHPARWIDDGPQVATKCGETGTPDATDETLRRDESYPYCGKCDDANKKEARRG